MTSTSSLVPATQPSAALIKTDVLGRMQRTREQRERILDAYGRSGLSGPKSPPCFFEYVLVTPTNPVGVCESLKSLIGK